MTTHTKARIFNSLPVIIFASGMVSFEANSREDYRAGVLEEVTVVAQRVEESLQETPIAVTAFSAAELQGLGIRSANEVAHYTPNMTAESQPGSTSTTNFTIRGITTTDPTLSVEAGVGVYLNGIYIARSNGLIYDVVDLQAIEVLRGPQGTLYGRNTTGGAVNIITAKPKGEWGFRQLLTAGNDSRFRSTTTLDTQEWAGLSAKLSYMHYEQDGFVDNLTTDPQQGSVGDFGERDEDAYNIALSWAPIDDLVFDFNYDNTQSASVPQGSQLTWASSDIARIVTDATFFPGCYDSDPLCAPINEAYAAAEAVASSDRVGRLNMPYAGKEDLDIDGYSLIASWDIYENLTLKSLTGYRELHLEQRTDLSGGGFSTSPGVTGSGVTTLFAAGIPNTKEQDQFSQELQLIGSLDRLEFIFGLYYFEESASETTQEQVALNLSFWGPAKIYDVDNTSKAIYGQATYSFSEALQLTAGLRYSEDEKKLFQDQAPDPTNPQTRIQANFSEDFDNVSGTLAVDYFWTPSISTYLKYATGYKSGGYFSRAAIQFQRPFDEETLVSYELGLKSEWMEKRLRANVAIFYSEYDDLQISQFVPGAGGAESVLSNAGKANFTGAEIELLAVPTPGLTLSLTYSWLDPEYDEYEFFDPTGQFCGTPETACDVSDRGVFPNTPEYSASVGARYEFAPTVYGDWSARVDVAWNDGYSFGTIEISDPSRIETDSYTLVNGRISLDNIDFFNTGTLRLSAWGKNLTDEEYRTNSIGAFESLGFTTTVYNEPLSWGLDVVYEY
ncbi:MAG: TonB-dependent receptor [Pseudomonadota bacterium]